MRRGLVLVLGLVACHNECIDEDGTDTCALCESHPLSCGRDSFILTWGCHLPPSPIPTTRTCEYLPPPCMSDRSCACLTASFDAGFNCSPSFGPRCVTDGGALELYCSPP